MALRTMEDSMKRLNAIHVGCTGQPLTSSSGEKMNKGEGDDDDPDFTKMSQFEKLQYLSMKEMKKVRTSLRKLDELESNSGGQKTAQSIELTNRVRKQINEMKKVSSDMRKLGREQNKDGEVDNVMQHVKKTEELYRKRFRKTSKGGEGDSDSDAGGGGGRSRKGPPRPKLSTEQDLSRPLVDTHDDPEFDAYYKSFKEKDKKIDEGLDLISKGVGRLGKMADDIGNELTLQDKLLDETEQKTDKALADLNQLNKRLKHTLDKVMKGDRFLMNCICILILFAIIGGIATSMT